MNSNQGIVPGKCKFSWFSKSWLVEFSAIAKPRIERVCACGLRWAGLIELSERLCFVSGEGWLVPVAYVITIARVNRDVKHLVPS